MNLDPLPGDPTGRRPHQHGSVQGLKNGVPVTAFVRWLVDTGSDIAVVRKSVGDQFDLTAVAASASSTTGGGILVKTGASVHFTLEVGHIDQAVSCAQIIGVKSGETGSNILGMAEVEAVAGQVDWNPGLQSGRLYK